MPPPGWTPVNESAPEPAGWTAVNEPAPRTWADTARTAGNVAVGALKGLGSQAIGLGQLIHAIPGAGVKTDAIGNAIGGLVGQAVYGTTPAPASWDAALPAATEQTTATNTPQLIGKVGADLATAIIPSLSAGSAAVDALPSVVRAGAKFQDVMSVAKNLTVDTQAPGEVALRIQQLAERGGSMPMAVRKFLGRITDPSKPDMAYAEARDFASNISRLSVNEFQRLTPTVAREVANLRVTLNQAVADTAQQAGKLDVYRSAMREYARAMELRNLIDGVIEGAKKAVPYVTAVGAGSWLTSRIRRFIGGD